MDKLEQIKINLILNTFLLLNIYCACTVKFMSRYTQFELFLIIAICRHCFYTIFRLFNYKNKVKL